MTNLHMYLGKFMWQLFEIKDKNYVLRNGLQLKAPQVKTKRYGINSLIIQGTSLQWKVRLKMVLP